MLPYEQLDRMIFEATAMAAGFRGLVRAEPLILDSGGLAGFEGRYHTIKLFQRTVLDLCLQSLRGEVDPTVAALLLNEIIPPFGAQYHCRILDQHMDTPLFFRTDEGVAGKISEIQCPGSGWGECAVLRELYEYLGLNLAALPDPAERFAASTIKTMGGKEPAIHYLLDNGALPNTIVYFLQKTRRHGLRYFGFDRGIRPPNVNMLRSHTFMGLIGDCLFQERLGRYLRRELTYDLPPTMIFDQKMPLLLPFWEKTRACFDDGVRSLFPFTALVTPEGITLPSGGRVALSTFAAAMSAENMYYLKYAGHDIPLHLPGRGVYYLGEMDTDERAHLLSQAATDYHSGKFWIIQEGFRHRTNAPYLNKEGHRCDMEFDTKFSGYYGPGGLICVDVMHGHGAILRQTADTVIGLCCSRS